MTYNLITVKGIINTFIDEHLSLNESVEDQDGQIILNRAIFDLESFLVKVRNNYGINERIDTSIVSEHILKNFTSTHPDNAYRRSDYQFNFLYHLAEHYEEGLDLVKLIDSFIAKFKKEFTPADLVITESGATRCKTNIRFALSCLRELGLVLNSKNNKRSWSPSILGLIALLNIKFMNEVDKKNTYKTAQSLKTLNTPDKKLSVYTIFDPTLVESIQQFHSNPLHLYLFLDAQKQNALNDEEKKLLYSIIERFIDFTQEGLTITSDGIKKTKVFDDKSKLFQQELFAIQEENQPFFDKLFAHFRVSK